MKEGAVLQEPGFRTLATAMLAISAPMIAGLMFTELPGKYSVMAIAAILLLLLSARYPEVILGLFITAGTFKNDPRFQFPFIDMTVFLGILTALGVFLAIRRKRTKLAFPPLEMSLPFLFICAISAFSLAYTMAPVYGLDKLLKFCTLSALAFFGAFYLLRGNNKIRNFMAAYIAVSLVTVFDVLQRSPKPGDDAISVVGSDYLTIGSVMATAFIMIFLYFFLSAKSPVRRAFYLLVPGLATLYVLMASGARGPFLSLILTLLIIILIARRPHVYSRRLTFWVCALLAAGGVYLAIDFGEFSRMSRRLSLFDEGGGDSVNIRISMIKSALQAMSTMPYFLIGLGIGGFSWYYGVLNSAGNLYTYPHNILLELGSETGIFGLAAIILLLYWSSRKAYSLVKNATGDNYYIAITITSIFIFAVLNALKSGDLNDHRLLYIMIGAIYALERDTKTKPSVEAATEGDKEIPGYGGARTLKMEPK